MTCYSTHRKQIQWGRAFQAGRTACTEAQRSDRHSWVCKTKWGTWPQGTCRVHAGGDTEKELGPGGFQVFEAMPEMWA